MAGAGYTLFTAGQTLTAAQVNTYLEQQTMMVFASAAARDTALASVLSEGLHAYLLDVNTITVYSGAAWSTVGPVHGSGLTWTPVVVQSNTPTLTVNFANYTRLGRFIHARCLVTLTSAGTASNVITISLPVAAAQVSDYSPMGTGIVADVSDTVSGYRSTNVVFASTTTAKFWSTLNTVSPTFVGAAGITAALASGDFVSLNVMYESAADG